MFPIQDANQARIFPLITWSILIANVMVFINEITMTRGELQAFISTYGVVPYRFVRDFGVGQWMTIVTSMFMHAGWLHLISNMWALHIFGDNIEDRMGHYRYLLFYLICGAAAALVQVFSGTYERMPTIGASGAIAGVLGGYFVLFPHAKIITLVPFGFIPLFIHVPAFVYLGIWFATQMFSGWASLDNSALAAQASVAFWAHIGGFVAGLLLVKLFERRDYRKFYKDEYWPW